ncbi:MAG: LysR family transcriptional regulator [Verrucomicrobia bacterium]|nr:LysR family transcriptional regulator [Verrucomicrobiota bacterium]
MGMNIHHLELFYYVAKHGGIAEAVRNMPYGIQQPAVSSQVIQLEEFLELTLFHRRPFALTPPGEKLFQFIEPFFSQVDRVAEELRGGLASQVRFGASELMLRDHLPEMVQSVRKKFPRLKLFLREDYQPQLMELLQQQAIDLAVTIVEGRPPPGLQVIPLLEAPLVLLVEKGSGLKSAEELWKQDKIEEPLICLPPKEPVSREFQAGLRRREVDWFPSIEVSSLALVETYVAKGYGIGVGVKVPRQKLDERVRLLELEKFPALRAGAVWQGKPSPVVEAILNEIKKRAQHLSS